LGVIEVVGRDQLVMNSGGCFSGGKSRNLDGADANQRHLTGIRNAGALVELRGIDDGDVNLIAWSDAQAFPGLRKGSQRQTHKTHEYGFLHRSSLSHEINFPCSTWSRLCS